MIIKGKQARLREDWLNDDKTMIITDSAYEIKEKLVHAARMTRILYDGTINKYMICDGYINLHTDMIKAALDNYYYPFKNGFMNSGVKKVQHAKENIFMSYVPNGAKEASDFNKLLENMAADTYTTMYQYDFGYIFSQEKNGSKKFTECQLYKTLGKCIKTENIEDYMPLVRK